MKNLFLLSFLACFLFLGNHAFAQNNDKIISQSLLISIKKHNATQTEYITKVDEEANHFDIEKFISENIATADIRIVGSIIAWGKTTRINFDSKKLDAQNGCNIFCKKIIEVKKTPLLGVQVIATDDLDGVLVETVFEGSAAEAAGIEQGDIIYYVDDTVIQSGCDLTMEMNDSEVGQVVDIHVGEKGHQRIVPAILGYKILENITYQYCCPSEVALENNKINANDLTVFPNPTRGLTELKFQTSTRGDLKIYITDVAGQRIYQHTINDFKGFYNESIDLTKYASGVYFLQMIQGENIWTEKIVLQKI
ncbi:MAG TPA: PDZ domain-containing protein [Phaeodactylibacter sp.]|nr:PDZ domain-containing protein [Phaeodactylibacter sp.]